jgi:hypothetical protein
LIGRIEAKLAARDSAGAELADAIKQADAAFRKMIDCGQAAIAAWPWQSHDTHAVLLTPGAVTAAITHELWKIGGRPRRYGGMDKPGDGIDFPGGRCPRLEWLNLPERVKSLATVCAEASALASAIMRTGRSTSHVESLATDAAVSTNGQGESPQRTEAEQRLASLLKRQHELAEDPAREAEYQRVVSEVVEAQAAVSAEQQVGAQGHAGS